MRASPNSGHRPYILKTDIVLILLTKEGPLLVSKIHGSQSQGFLWTPSAGYKEIDQMRIV